MPNPLYPENPVYDRQNGGSPRAEDIKPVVSEAFAISMGAGDEEEAPPVDKRYLQLQSVQRNIERYPLEQRGKIYMRLLQSQLGQTTIALRNLPPETNGNRFTTDYDMVTLNGQPTASVKIHYGADNGPKKTIAIQIGQDGKGSIIDYTHFVHDRPEIQRYQTPPDLVTAALQELPTWLRTKINHRRDELRDIVRVMPVKNVGPGPIAYPPP